MSAAPDVDGLFRLGVRPPMRGYLRSLWDRRDFVIALPVSQLRGRNANTVLGGAWHLLNPLALGAAYFIVFGILFDARNDIDNYVAFLVIGLFVFYYTQKCLTGGATTIVANSGIIRNVGLPRAVFPVGSVITETLVHLPALGLLVALAVITGESPTLAWLLLLPILLMQAAFNLGLSLWVGRLTFHFRDVQNLLPFLTRLWLYLSGVFFVADRVPEGWARTLFELNPVYLFIDLHRTVLLGAESPTVAASFAALAWATATLVTGFFFFWSSEDTYGRE
jgi:teichoic acid transport system permease protein